MERPLHKQSDENRDFCSGFCWQHSFIIASSNFEPLEVKADDRKAKPAPQIKIMLKIKRGKLNKKLFAQSKGSKSWNILINNWKKVETLHEESHASWQKAKRARVCFLFPWALRQHEEKFYDRSRKSVGGGWGGPDKLQKCQTHSLSLDSLWKFARGNKTESSDCKISSCKSFQST